MKNDTYWREKLKKKRADLELLSAAGQEAQAPVELDQTRVGRLSRMDDMQRQAMHRAIAARREQAVMRISSAIERLDDGEFGYCLKCGDAIAEKRLELDPSTLHCTDCTAG